MAGSDDMTGRRISVGYGGYTITRRLAEGGMGAVYLAEHGTIVGRRGAVKTLLPSLAAHQEVVERFISEARAAAVIDHENVIEILDAAWWDDGRPYILMPYLDGSELGDYCRTVGEQLGHPNRLPVAHAWALMVQVCAGLQAAHKGNVIHRDLKPSNIMVTRDRRGKPLAIIVDFGIAKVLDPTLRIGAATLSQMVLGTPGYMPPEQARGQPIDQRADVYAFGGMFYHVITGRRPFDAPSEFDLITAQLSGDVEPPHHLVREIPIELSHLLMACLAPDPDNRPRTIADVAVRCIAAIPDGLRIAQENTRDDFAETGPSELTVRAPRVPRFSALVPIPPRPPPGSATTPMAAAVSSRSSSGRPFVQRSAFYAVGAVVIAAAVVLTVLRLTAHRSDDDRSVAPPASSSNATSDAAPMVAKGAMPPDASLASPVDAPLADAASPVVPADAAGARSRDGGPKAQDESVRRAPSAPGSIVIRATPFADVWIDGRSRGTTPIDEELSPGRHKLRLGKPDGTTENVTVTIKGGQATRIERTYGPRGTK